MSDQERKAFEKAYSNVKAPEALKTETYQRMLAGDLIIHRKKKRTLAKFVCGGMTGVMVCAAVILFVLRNPSGVKYITPMEEGVYYEDVELKNGEIHFIKSRMAISVTPNGGMITIGGEDEANGAENGFLKEEIQAESGGSFIFEKTDEVSLPEIAENSWSYIDEQRIYVTVLRTKDIIYQAVFEKDDGVYQLVGTGVTQKEFIDLLYKKIK